MCTPQWLDAAKPPFQAVEALLKFGNLAFDPLEAVIEVLQD